jgi:hypothetical protein
MKFFQIPIVAILSGLLMTLPTGCTVSQAKINTVVQNIATWAPVIVNDATSLAANVASFDPDDAVIIQKYVTTIQTDGTLLTAVSNQYLANPSPILLAQISSLVSDLATTDSSALLAALQIKNANSLMIAKGVLATIATATVILSTYLTTINVAVTPAAAQSIEQMKPVVNKVTLIGELNKAKTQNLIPENTTLQQFGF